MTDIVPSTTGSEGDKPPLTVRAVERVANAFAGRGTTRRGFLFRTAVVGSALAADPFGYVLKPGTAYASVCGSGNTCGAGWSVFCCTINDGKNTCPSGSFVAGWWKVDASAFCLGSPRYYIDCNRKPGASCRCRCNNTSCDRRRVCCNVFRYGQCNTHIGGVTEVVCRLITCTPPWEWDRACSRTVRTENATRSHSARCLPPENPTHIQIKYQDMGMRGSVLGDPAGRERDAERGGRKRSYANGMILWHRDTGAHEVHGNIAERYKELGADRSGLGYPRRDHHRVADGHAARFQRGWIYSHRGTGTQVVMGRSSRRYRQVGGPKGKLGWPTSDTRKPRVPGRVTDFEHGAIFVSARTEPIEVMGAILDVFRARGGLTGSKLGYPKRHLRRYSDGSVRQVFEHGMIAGPSATKVFAVRAPIAARWGYFGGHDGTWGNPDGHTEDIAGGAGLFSSFEHAKAYYKDGVGVHWIKGRIYRKYLAEGGPDGWLGFPISDWRQHDDGTQRAHFENGEIVYEPGKGTRAVPKAP